jgi:6-phospho-3-hexuloisomerase
MELKDLSKKVLNEIDQCIEKVKNQEIERLIQEITIAKRIFILGLGREALMIKAFAMRLMHLGLEVDIVGDVTTPRITNKDLLIATVGTGYCASTGELVRIAKEKANAKVALITAAAESKLAPYVDITVRIPAQTMAQEAEAKKSIQPMGSLFEQAELIFFDCLLIILKDRLGRKDEDLEKMHTILE